MIYRFLGFLLLIVQLVCLGLLWLSCFPGELHDAPILVLGICLVLLVCGLPILGIIILVEMLLWRRHSSKNSSQFSERLITQKQLPAYPKRLGILTCQILLVTSALLATNLPQRIAFLIFSPAFNAFIANSDRIANLCDRNYEQHISEQLGLYRVLACDRDPRGGIYLKTNEVSGIVFYSEAHGFVYQPNPQGSRIFSSGKKHDIYQYAPVVGDWHWFQAGKTY
jgi:hypothetical protein